MPVRARPRPLASSRVAGRICCARSCCSAARTTLYRLVRGHRRRPGRATRSTTRATIDPHRAATLGLFVEPERPALGAGARALADFASWMYVNSHFAITTVTLAFLYLRRNERFYFVRNMFMVAMGIALVLLRRSSRPRRRGCCPSSGSRLGRGLHRRRRRDTAPTLLFNPFAAVPVDARRVRADARRADGRDRRAAAGPRRCGALYPPLVTFVVIATANHWWFDALPRRRRRRASPRPPPGRVRPRAARRVGMGRRRPRADRARLTFPRDVHTARRAPPARPPRTAREYQTLMRNRLIESRLTPNAISLTGFALCVVAAVLVWQELLLPRRHRVHRRLGLRHARRPLLAHVGQGHAVRRVPGLDARPHRGGHRARPPSRVLLRPGRRPRGRRRRVAVLASLMVSYTRARAEALGVECKVGIADRAVRVVILSAGLVFAGLRRSICWRRRSMCWPGCPSSPSSSASGTCAGADARAVADCNEPRAGVRSARIRTPESKNLTADTSARPVARNGTRPLPGGQGPRRDHRRGQLRHAFVQGVHYYKDADPSERGPRPHARRPRRLPRPRHRVLGRVRHRRRQGRQGPLRGDLRRPEQHDQVRRGKTAEPRRARPARHDPRRPRQVPQGEDHQGRGLDRRHRADPQGHARPTSSSPTCRSAPSRRPSGTSSRSSRPAARS